MTGSAQPAIHETTATGAFSRNSRVSWIGSKLIQSIGIEPERLDAVHQAMWLRITGNDTAVQGEVDHLAAKIAEVAHIAEKAAATGGSNAAMVAVMRESGTSLDPMLAQNFLRLAASPIFWMALDSAGEGQAS